MLLIAIKNSPKFTGLWIAVYLSAGVTISSRPCKCLSTANSPRKHGNEISIEQSVWMVIRAVFEICLYLFHPLYLGSYISHNVIRTTNCKFKWKFRTVLTWSENVSKGVGLTTFLQYTPLSRITVVLKHNNNNNNSVLQDTTIRLCFEKSPI